MLAITISNNDTLSDKLTNAFWLAGIFLDVFGAVLATLTVSKHPLAQSYKTGRMTSTVGTMARSALSP